MNVDGLFESPGTQIADFFRVQTLLYRNDPRLQDYFMALQLIPQRGKQTTCGDLPSSHRLFRAGIRAANRIAGNRPPKKIKTDVLFCPLQYFGRKTENRFSVRTILGLVQTGAKVLCLLPGDAPLRDEMGRELAAVGRGRQVEFLDPFVSANPVEARVRPHMIRMRAKSALEQTISILGPEGLAPGWDTKGSFEHTAGFIEAWERLAPEIEFSAVIARCHWHSLCSSICRTAYDRKVPVVTFQQGVIGHSLDAPVTASQYVAFGQASASFLSQLNRRFFEECGTPELAVSYVPSGSLYDTISELPNQWERQTLLMVDQPIAQEDFYGVEGQSRALLHIAERLLASDIPLRRLIIRPHPFWSNLDFSACQELIRKFPMRCELSHPAWSLEDDFRRSSIAIGIFSGVLTVASACGLPAFFVQTEGGYAAGDLACFSPAQTILPEAAIHEIGNLLRDQKVYCDAREAAMRNARVYYKDGGNAQLDGRFFDRVLAASPEIGSIQ
jgi:hypothetical protein